MVSFYLSHGFSLSENYPPKAQRWTLSSYVYTMWLNPGFLTSLQQKARLHCRVSMKPRLQRNQRARNQNSDASPRISLLWLKSDPSVKGMQTQNSWKLKATLLSQTPRVKGVKLMSLREFDSLGGGAVKNWQDTNISGGRKQRIKESKALPIEVKLTNQETKFHSL